jgi:hypothetical protein
MKAPTAAESFGIHRALAWQAPAELTQTEAAHHVAPNPIGLSESVRRARAAFDLDVCMAQLDMDYPPTGRPQSTNGAAGVRLRAHLKADISDDRLREFARDTLGAKRCSATYLNALQIVLGNQADAEQKRYTLEMNRRVSFAPQRVMRTIIDQMQAAGVTFGSVVGLGEGRAQTVQCFDNSDRVPYLSDRTSRAVAEAALERIERVRRRRTMLDLMQPHPAGSTSHLPRPRTSPNRTCRTDTIP